MNTNVALQAELEALRGRLAAREAALYRAEALLAECEERFNRLTERVSEDVFIAGHKRAAAAEQQSRDLVGKIFRASPAGIALSRISDGIVLEVNDALVHMSGYAREELVGRSSSRHWILPEQRADIIRQLRDGASMQNVEVETHDRAGQPKVYRGSFQHILVDGEPCLLSVVLDVTEQQRAEAALREREATLRGFYDTASQMMGVVELYGDDILHISDSVASAAFYGTTPEAMRRRWASALGADASFLKVCIDACRESKRLGEPVHFEYVHQRGGDDCWLLATVTHIQTLPAGEDRYSYVITDATERKKTERELVEAKERAEATARLRKAILNNITHEVRTPLTVIVGFTSMLRRGVHQEYQRFVDRIERSGHRLMRMLDTILDLAQLEAGTYGLEPEPVDVMELIEKAAGPLRSQAEEKGLVLEIQQTGGRLHARLDHRILVRIVQNLLDNAIKFTDAGRIRVAAGADDHKVYLKISDTGVGIDEVYLAHVFDEFSQESSGLERTHQGSGLGLAVSQRLVELAGGTISVESHKGKGSLFTIELPRFDDDGHQHVA